MKRKIKVALYIRVVLLIGPGFCYYLLTNTLLNNNNNDESKDDNPSSNDFSPRFSSRSLLNVKDKDTRNESKSQHEINTNASTTDLLNSEIGDSVRSANLDSPHDVRIRGDIKKNGRIMVHIILSCYCFLMLAIICDEYFLGSIEIICQKLNVKKDIAGATIMAMATSSPELIISCVGTFITEGDVGVATVVGSAVFNILAIPACCGLFTRTAIQLDWWPVSRDCVFYGFSVILLTAVIYDKQIMWYEAASLVAAYGVYLMFMYKDEAMSEKAKILARKVKRRIYQQPYLEVAEITPLFTQTKKMNVEFSEPSLKLTDSSIENFATNPWVTNDMNKLLFLLRWPITFLLWCTIPDPKRFKRFYVLTFINCILWIGCISYFTVFVSSNVDSLMGMTFLAAGTSVPEAVSSVVVTAQGYGSMGISNSIGSNTFDILLCLGLPWLIKTLIVPSSSGQTWITLKSTGISYTIFTLLTALIALYFPFLFNKFNLDKKIGITFLMLYLLFLIFAAHVDLNVFFPFNPTDK